MNELRVPLIFNPIYKDYLWGGTRLVSKYKRTLPSDIGICAESWEIAANKDGESVVSSGSFADKGLIWLTTKYGAALVGTRAPDPTRFPLLFKLIDARKHLSVQVHPNRESAARVNLEHKGKGKESKSEPKTEMWVVLACTPDACLYAGLPADVTKKSLRDALKDKDAVASQLVRLPVESGQALFIPGGLIHAIGAGCLIYEVQQNSNTTYRLFDWNRTDADGKSRPLHIKKSFQTIDWSLPVPQMIKPSPCRKKGTNQWSNVIVCEYFYVRQLKLTTPLDVPVDGTSFHELFSMRGRVSIRAGGEEVVLAEGGSALIPADAGVYTLTPDKSATLIVTTL